jgi:hypothetical protein
MEAGPGADQPSRLRTPPGVGPRYRRLGAQVSVTRLKEKLSHLRETEAQQARKEHHMKAM